MVQKILVSLNKIMIQYDDCSLTTSDTVDAIQYLPINYDRTSKF